MGYIGLCKLHNCTQNKMQDYNKGKFLHKQEKKLTTILELISIKIYLQNYGTVFLKTHRVLYRDDFKQMRKTNMMKMLTKQLFL